MALSNIFREPRREITESLAGIAVLAVLVLGDSVFANWFHVVTGGDRMGCPLPIAYVIGPFVLLLLFICVILTHALGEVVCGWLAKRGLELRPKVRY